MSSSDAPRQLLVDFFGLPSAIEPENITQKAIPAWDSLASVQLIAELQDVSTLTSMSNNSDPTEAIGALPLLYPEKALLISAPALKTHPDCR